MAHADSWQASGSDSWQNVDTAEESDVNIINTPEPWDVVEVEADQAGLMRASISLLQEQLRQVCTQVAEVNGHVAQLHVQLAAQQALQQQNQDVLSHLLQSEQMQQPCVGMRNADVATPMQAFQPSVSFTPVATIAQSGPVSSSKARARPGPRERLRQRQELERKQQRHVLQEDSEATSSKEMEVVSEEGLFGHAAPRQNRRRQRALFLALPAALCLSSLWVGACGWWFRGHSLLELREEADWEGSSQQFPLSPAADLHSSVRKLRKLGHLRLAVSDCHAAVEWFNSALDVNSQLEVASRMRMERQMLSQLRGDLGFSLACAARFEEAVDHLQAALSSSSGAESPPHWQNALGYAFFRLGKFDMAQQTFQAALVQHGDNPILWNNLAAASMSLPELDVSTADEALYHAMHKASKLRHAPSVRYYQQVFSNNAHILRALSAGVTSALPALHVESYNCLVGEVRSLAQTASKPKFIEVFAGLSDDTKSGQEGLIHSREAILSLESETILCPHRFDV